MVGRTHGSGERVNEKKKPQKKKLPERVGSSLLHIMGQKKEEREVHPQTIKRQTGEKKNQGRCSFKSRKGMHGLGKGVGEDEHAVNKTKGGGGLPKQNAGRLASGRERNKIFFTVVEKKGGIRGKI